MDKAKLRAIKEKLEMMKSIIEIEQSKRNSEMQKMSENNENFSYLAGYNKGQSFEARWTLNKIEEMVEMLEIFEEIK